MEQNTMCHRLLLQQLTRPWVPFLHHRLLFQRPLPPLLFFGPSNGLTCGLHAFLGPFQLGLNFLKAPLQEPRRETLIPVAFGKCRIGTDLPRLQILTLQLHGDSEDLDLLSSPFRPPHCQLALSHDDPRELSLCITQSFVFPVILQIIA